MDGFADTRRNDDDSRLQRFKTVFSSFLTIVGMGVMVFIFVIFFSLISDAFAYFFSLYKEILFRVV